MMGRYTRCLAMLATFSMLGASCSEEVPQSNYNYPPAGDPGASGDGSGGDHFAGDGDSQPVCQPQCTLGHKQCAQNSAQECNDVLGCPTWVTVDVCNTLTEACELGICEPIPCNTGDIAICDNVGVCRNGQAECVNGVWSLCDWQIGPSLEICDGQDNDCNGTTDDLPPTPLCPLQDGVCVGTRQRCNSDTHSLVCDNVAYSANATTSGWVYEEGDESRCDNLDNDCDGEADEDPERTLCPTRHVCDGGACVCAPSLTPCGDECVDTTVDRDHCGECFRTCTPLANGSVACVDSDCAHSCDDDYRMCGGVCAECPTVGVFEHTCNGSECAANSCGASFEPCDNACCYTSVPVLITEVWVDDNMRDTIELFVLQSQPLTGMTVYANNQLVYTFPTTPVFNVGDFIVLHMQESGTDEIGGDPTASTDTRNTVGYDFWAAGEAIPASDADLELVDTDGSTLDYLVWASCCGDSLISSTLENRAEAHVVAGDWHMQGDHIVGADAVDSTLDDGTGKCMQRLWSAGAPLDTNDASDWTGADCTLGLSNS